MSDRTWNQIDAKLYEEDWSRGARIVAGVLLARCPNQYGVFDFPKGYLRDLFEGLYSGLEIDAFMQEWEEAGFVKFYRKRTVIWIRSKWKRSGLPSDNHWKGLKAHLMDFPEVQEDFLSYYEPHWKGIQSPSEPPRSKPKPPVNPESESESESEKSKKTSKKELSCADFQPELALLVDELFPDSEYSGWTNGQRLKQVDALDKLIRIDGFPQDEVFEVLRFARKDDFWNPVFQSIPRLREDGQKKFRNMRGQWLKAKTSPGAVRKAMEDMDGKFKEDRQVQL